MFLKKYHPGLAKYFYMNTQKREEYFEKLNKDYLEKIDLETNINKPIHGKRLDYKESMNIVQEFNKNMNIKSIECVNNECNNGGMIRGVLKKLK